MTFQDWNKAVTICPESLLPEANSKHWETDGWRQEGKTRNSGPQGKRNESLAFDPGADPVFITKLLRQADMEEYTFNPNTRRQGQADLCEFKTILVYTASSRLFGDSKNQNKKPSEAWVDSLLLWLSLRQLLLLPRL